MTWTRLHDGFVDDPVFDGLAHDARWHYLCLIQYCSRTGRYDGYVTRDVTRRVSDVTSPETSVAALVARGLLVEHTDGITISLPRIEEHVPPPHLRDEQRKSAQRVRKQRQRQRERSEAVPEAVTSEVTRDIGTGQVDLGVHEKVEVPKPRTSLVSAGVCDFCGATGDTVIDSSGRRLCARTCQKPKVA